ncbi:MAG: hypothetical protein M0C28_15825 [Candidatus Moduliflexus flocculans]|nr:hypothetical protein [Candidatus Moduliflexus flocculans]
MEKIVGNVFGVFLPECASVLLYNNEAVGVCFANITNSFAANISSLMALKTSIKIKAWAKFFCIILLKILSMPLKKGKYSLPRLTRLLTPIIIPL